MRFFVLYSAEGEEVSQVKRVTFDAKFLRFLVALTITIGIFIFLLSRISFTSVMASLQKADVSLIILAFLISFGGNALMDAYRWKVILNYLRYPVSFREALFIKIVANLFISLLPLRSGELSRLVYLKRLRNIPYAKSILSIIVEYCHKIFVLLVCLFTGICLYFFENSRNHVVSGPYFFSSVFVPLCLLKLSIFKNVQTQYDEKIKPHLTELKGALTNRTILFCNVLYSCGELINFYLLSKSLSIEVPFYAVLIFIPLVIFISALPFTIAGLGSRELTVLFLFKDYASPEVLLTLGVLYSFVEFLFPSFIGIFVIAAFTERVLKPKNGNEERTEK